MKRIKNISIYFWNKIKRYKYILTGCFTILFFVWYFCLPRQLFDDPTSTVLFDKDGHLLGAVIADDGQWRFPYNSNVPYKFKTALIQFEDRRFENHWGVSFKGLCRAAYQNIKGGRKISGGSTITMQLMRMSRKSGNRNFWQKLVEIFWATRAEWRYSKDEILALYSSNAPMGGNVVGLDAASWRYFGRPADELTWAESATLAILPNAPALIHPGRNRDELLAKRNKLLKRLYEIDEIDSLVYRLSLLEPLPDAPYPMPMIAPHLMTRCIKDGLKGTVIHTTLNISIQQRVNSIVRFHHDQLKRNEIFNAAVLVMEVSSGNIVAYTGNVPDLEAEHSKDVDIITAPRSTGSILKPFLYAGMLATGEITPSMLIQDIPTVMSGYSPKNYNLKYDGIISASEALSKSLNVPLVRMLTKFGIGKFHFLLNKLKLSTIHKSPSHYGLSLILGGAEATLWDLVSAYGMMARALKHYPTYPYNVNQTAHYILNHVDSIIEFPVINPAACWFTFEAMKEVMRPEEDLNWELFSTSQKIAWKTGTSFGFRDAWAIGVTTDYVVGVWVGNADGEGRPGLTGRQVAAPLLFDVFSSLPKSDWFSMPYDEMSKVDICLKSGYRSGEACDNVQEKWIPKSALNTIACPYHQFIYLDKEEKYRVNSSCYDLANAKRVSWFILPPEASYYYKNKDPNFSELPVYMNGCEQSNETSEIAILYPKNKSKIYVPLNFEEVKEQIVFEATHKQHKMILYWHLDNNYLGSTNTVHQMEHIPSVGIHLLSIIDENGKTASVQFEVIGKIND